MHTLTVYNLGNADCCRIDLANGQKLLFDYANCRGKDDAGDLRADLEAELRRNLQAAKRASYDVVAFTHADKDHIVGASDFFYLEHAKKYQGDGRIKIDDMWVPDALVIEEKLDGDAAILRAEARYRLIEGRGIHVFSRSDRLEEWFKERDIAHNDWADLIVDAGTCVPTFTLAKNGVEFFAHSPFANYSDGGYVERNERSLVVQATFDVGAGYPNIRVILAGDAPHEVLSEIVTKTKGHRNQHRLEWDVFKIPHHCSYLALSAEKGKDITVPDPEIRWLYEQGADGGIIISSSKPIPTTDQDPQPPHRQAANYYRERAANIPDGEFVVTMEHPKISHPEPLVITLGTNGATVKKIAAAASIAVTGRPAPRAG